MSVESRPRQSGKVYETALVLARKCGLPVDVISGLLGAGWTYSERSGSPHRWESPVAALEKVEGCGYEREVLIKTASSCICAFVDDQYLREQTPREVRGNVDPDCEVHGAKAKGQSA